MSKASNSWNQLGFQNCNHQLRKYTLIWNKYNLREQHTHIHTHKSFLFSIQSLDKNKNKNRKKLVKSYTLTRFTGVCNCCFFPIHFGFFFTNSSLNCKYQFWRLHFNDYHFFFALWTSFFPLWFTSFFIAVFNFFFMSIYFVYALLYK